MPSGTSNTLQLKEWVSDLIDVTSTGDKAHFRPSFPTEIYRWGIIVLDELDVNTAHMDFALDKRVTAGSDTGRTEVDDLVFDDADSHGGSATGDVPAGDVWYRDLAIEVAAATGSDGSTVRVAPTGPTSVNPGEELVFEVVTAPGTDGDVAFFIHYEQDGAFTGPDVGTNVTAGET